MERRLSDWNMSRKQGDIVEVFGWYEQQEWVQVELVEYHESRGEWSVTRVQE